MPVCNDTGRTRLPRLRLVWCCRRRDRRQAQLHRNCALNRFSPCFSYIQKKKNSHLFGDCFLFWLRRQDSNLRPPGYEPDELPTALLRDIGAPLECLDILTQAHPFVKYFFFFLFVSFRQPYLIPVLPSISPMPASQCAIHSAWPIVNDLP